MSETRQPTPFGRSNPPNEAWLAKQPSEPILEPDLPIIDTHHHLWQRPQHRYLLDELLADLRSGHNVVATVFAECHSMYRANGPEAFRPVGETEFVTGIAAMSASGLYGPIRVAAGIVGFADLTLGDRVEPVLEAHECVHEARRHDDAAGRVRLWDSAGATVLGTAGRLLAPLYGDLH